MNNLDNSNFNFLYENGFFADFKYWVRYYDPVTKESGITNDCPQQWEYYKLSPNGKFKSIYSEDRYDVQYGQKKDSTGYGCTSAISPIDLAIREQYRNRSNLNPRVMYLDIETRVGTVYKGFPSPDKALEPVSLIQFLDSETQVVHIIGDKEFYYKEYYLKQPDHLGKKVCYWHCDTEIEMFEKFFEFIRTLKPAIAYAWNGEGFDFGYLYNRCVRIGLNPNGFSPFSDMFSEKTELTQMNEREFMNQKMFALKSAGILYIDIKELYRKLRLAPKPSYSLNAVAEDEVDARKIEHSEFKTFDDFYLGNWTLLQNPSEYQKSTLCYQLHQQGADYEEIRKAGHGQFVYYGIIDVVLLQEIDKKINLTSLMCVQSNKMNSQYDSILGTVKPWSNYIRNVLYDMRVIITPETIAKRGCDVEKTITGGFVRDPNKGKHKWVLSADVNSMYPMLSISGSNMSPEQFVFPWELKDSGAEGYLKKFALEYLKVGTSEEQNEANLLEVLKDKELSKKVAAALQEANLAMAPNGVFFRKETKGVIPTLVSEIYSQRKKTKKAMFRKEQQSIKIAEILRHRNE